VQKNGFFLFVLAASFLSSCGPEKLVDTSQVLKSGVWAYADSLRFEATVEDTSRLYDISLWVRHDKSYAYQYLFSGWENAVTAAFPGFSGKDGGMVRKMYRKKLHIGSADPAECFFQHKGEIYICHRAIHAPGFPSRDTRCRAAYI
jgi:hypothetical protein